MKKTPILNLLIATLSLFLFACAGNKSADEADILGEEIIYEKASRAMSQGRFESAINYFQSLEARFPFSTYALQAQLDLAYAYYKHGRRERAISQADRFIRLNPMHEAVDYAYYLKGLANFEEEPKFLVKWYPRKPSDLDQEPLLEAFKEFSQLIRKYPDSPYAADAHQRLVYLRNELADYEIKVANFYLERRAYIAAANRAKYVLEHFPEAPVNIDAIVIMIKAYRKLEAEELANNAVRILALNQPNHPLLHKK